MSGQHIFFCVYVHIHVHSNNILFWREKVQYSVISFSEGKFSYFNYFRSQS